jgi:anti-sigma-K factor RskA
MRHFSPEILDALAAEYVLGTQTCRVRERLTRLQEEDTRLAERVAWWQEKLAPLGESVPPIPVPLRVWRGVESTLRPQAADPGPQTGWWNSLLLWRWSTVLAAGLAFAVLLIPPPEPRPDTFGVEGGVVLVLTDEESRTAWVVSRKSAEDPLKAQPLALPVLTLEQAYELWLLPPDAAPLSLGLLDDTGRTVLQVPENVNVLLQPGFSMAVSIEPPGGSPTGAPTGPVVFSGSINEL